MAPNCVSAALLCAGQYGIHLRQLRLQQCLAAATTWHSAQRLHRGTLRTASHCAVHTVCTLGSPKQHVCGWCCAVFHARLLDDIMVASYCNNNATTRIVLDLLLSWHTSWADAQGFTMQSALQDTSHPAPGQHSSIEPGKHPAWPSQQRQQQQEDSQQSMRRLSDIEQGADQVDAAAGAGAPAQHAQQQQQLKPTWDSVAEQGAHAAAGGAGASTGGGAAGEPQTVSTILQVCISSGFCNCMQQSCGLPAHCVWSMRTQPCSPETLVHWSLLTQQCRPGLQLNISHVSIQHATRVM